MKIHLHGFTPCAVCETPAESMDLRPDGTTIICHVGTRRQCFITNQDARERHLTNQVRKATGRAA